MSDQAMVGLFMIFFGAMFVVFAGILAIDPPFLEVLLWRSHQPLDKKHPKQHARIWAKGMLIIALGPAIGGAVMYLAGSNGIEHGGFTVLFLGCVAFFIYKGCKYITREVSKLNEKEEE
ncbi:MAG: hypothetical protein K5770_10070 [Lachnospiraceae bacterium]|nr:hypothetical protein [Lachnospiraceae bacterium]